MNLTWSLAWRNLWRHGRRTWLTVGAMVFSNILLVFLISLQLGSYEMMINNSLAMFTGHLQVQQEGYQQEQKMRQSVPAALELADHLRGELNVETVAVRAGGFALASSEQRSIGIQILGVQPQREMLVSTIPGLVSRGRYLSAMDAEEIVIGATLARNLRIDLGDELTFLGTAADGSMAVGIVTVVGILDTGVNDLDRSISQVPLGYFQRSFGLGDQAHTIVVTVPAIEEVDSAVAYVRGLLPAANGLVVLDWDTLQPGLRQAIKADMSSAWFMYAVLIFLVALSVLNTQLMSVMERTREFGVMIALGTRPGQLARLVLGETLMMSLLGLGLGLLLGGVLVVYLANVGFTFPGMAEMGERFGLPDRMYPEVSLLSMFWGPSVVFVGALLAALYPAARLFKLNPLTAMKAI